MSAFGWLGRTAIVVLAISTPAWAQQGLRWESDVETAQRLAADSHRLVLLHFGAKWCPPCQRLEKNVFSQPGFGKELDTSYVAVKLDFDKYHSLANKYGVTQIPADVITTPTGQLLQRLPSPSSGSRYVDGLQLVAAKHAPAVPANEPLVAANTPPSQAAPAADAGYTPLPTAMPEAPANEAPAATEPPPAAYTYTAPPAAAPVEAPVHPPVAAQASSVPAVTLPPGSPPLALDGYCPVMLVDKSVWTQGDVRWGAIHRGRTYLFSTQDSQQKFLANPDHFSPVMAGNDPVLALDERQEVPGKREFGVFVDGRIYLFSGQATLDKFMKSSNRYAAEVTQAMKQ